MFGRRVHITWGTFHTSNRCFCPQRCAFREWSVCAKCIWPRRLEESSAVANTICSIRAQEAVHGVLIICFLYSTSEFESIYCLRSRSRYGYARQRPRSRIISSWSGIKISTLHSCDRRIRLVNSVVALRLWCGFASQATRQTHTRSMQQTSWSCTC